MPSGSHDQRLSEYREMLPRAERAREQEPTQFAVFATDMLRRINALKRELFAVDHSLRPDASAEAALTPAERRALDQEREEASSAEKEFLEEMRAIRVTLVEEMRKNDTTDIDTRKERAQHQGAVATFIERARKWMRKQFTGEHMPEPVPQDLSEKQRSTDVIVAIGEFLVGFTHATKISLPLDVVGAVVQGGIIKPRERRRILEAIDGVEHEGSVNVHRHYEKLFRELAKVIGTSEHVSPTEADAMLNEFSELFYDSIAQEQYLDDAFFDALEESIRSRVKSRIQASQLARSAVTLAATVTLAKVGAGAGTVYIAGVVGKQAAIAAAKVAAAGAGAITTAGHADRSIKAVQKVQNASKRNAA
jgi:hypothetical protein